MHTHTCIRPTHVHAPHPRACAHGARARCMQVERDAFLEQLADQKDLHAALADAKAESRAAKLQVLDESKRHAERVERLQAEGAAAAAAAAAAARAPPEAALEEARLHHEHAIEGLRSAHAEASRVHEEARGSARHTRCTQGSRGGRGLRVLQRPGALRAPGAPLTALHRVRACVPCRRGGRSRATCSSCARRCRRSARRTPPSARCGRVGRPSSRRSSRARGPGRARRARASSAKSSRRRRRARRPCEAAPRPRPRSQRAWAVPLRHTTLERLCIVRARPQVRRQLRELAASTRAELERGAAELAALAEARQKQLRHEHTQLAEMHAQSSAALKLEQLEAGRSEGEAQSRARAAHHPCAPPVRTPCTPRAPVPPCDRGRVGARLQARRTGARRSSCSRCTRRCRPSASRTARPRSSSPLRSCTSRRRQTGEAEEEEEEAAAEEEEEARRPPRSRRPRAGLP